MLYHFLYPRGGREQIGPAHNQLAIDPAERQWGFFPATWLASMDQIPVLLSFGGLHPYTPGMVTETKDNSATIGAVPDGIGIRFQTGGTPADNDDVAISGLNAAKPALGKDWFGFCRVQMPDVSNMGFTFGVATSGLGELFTANPDDGVFFYKAKNSAALTLRVCENGNGPVNITDFAFASGTGALNFTNNTDLVLGFHFRIGSSAASSTGEVWMNGYRTVLSSSQISALYAMLTTPTSLSPYLGFRVNGTTQKSAVVAACCVGCWR